MTSQQLPERPNLEQLKKQAKTLLHAAQNKDTAALARFKVLPALASKTDAELAIASVALHDAQSVIAREHGFPSWNRLREHVEEQSLSFAAAVDEFVRCATGNAPGRAFRLLGLHPGIAHASLQAELVLGDAAAVERRLKNRPSAATEAGGVQNWEPLLYVCHTCLHHDAPARADGLVAMARLLLARGANPNAFYTWRWHAELPRTALWGAMCAMGHLPLAEVLLEAGANPTDGVSLHMAASGGNLAALELLRRHGVNVNGIPGGLPPLRYILEFTENIAGPRWLLEHGADANLTWGELDEAAIHVAARKLDLPLVELLARHGADLSRRRKDGRTPYALAELQGNVRVAQWLFAQGAGDELSDLDRFVAACARGDRATAESMLRARPELRRELRREHHLMLQVPAEHGDVGVVETMLACGFDPAAKDKDNVTALHRAAMDGRAEVVRVLLAHGAPIDARDGMFDAPPLIWAAEGSRRPQGNGVDHRDVVRQLIAAGAKVEWMTDDATPGPERIWEALAELGVAMPQSAAP